MKKKGFDTSTLEIQSIIVHTIPKHKKGDLSVLPKYSENVCALTEGLKAFFKDKIVSALDSENAFRIDYDTESTSPIQSLMTDLVGVNSDGLVENSKKIAGHLFQIQAGQNNSGILVIIEGKVNNKPACIILKLEMDNGAQLILDAIRNAYDIKEIEDLMLTRKTKVYKVALLVNKSDHGVHWDGMIVDYQIDTKARSEVKTWFMYQFLGCKASGDPRVATQQFFNLTRNFINMVEDDVTKAKYFQDLNSYVQKNSTVISPLEFAEDYLISADHKNDYKKYLEARKFKFEGFPKDISQIQRQIQKITLEFTNGVSIVGDKGTFSDKVTLEKMDNGETKAQIISRVKKIK